MILVILVIAIAVIIGIVVSLYFLGRPYDKTNNSYKKVRIGENYTNEDVADVLYKKGIIGSRSRFLKLTALHKHDGEYRNGTYYLSPSMSFRVLAYTLTNGISTDNGFTIPAGYDVKQIASSLEQAGFCSSDEFLDAAAGMDLSMFDFIDTSVGDYTKIEGFLFPGKYDVNEDASAEMIIITMLNEFDNNFTPEYRARAEELGLSIRDIITVAGIIEKATSVDKEKADISSVIHNRINMETEENEDYPGDPQCSPGEASINAALYPEDTSFLYYVPDAKLDGTHVYSADRDEYLSLKEAYEKALEEKKAAQEKEDADRQ